MKKLLIILVITFTLCACSNPESNNIKLDQNGFLTKESITTIVEENEYVLLDVRTKEEYDEEHLTDSINIPYDTIDSNIDINKDKIILVYCKSGNRAGIAVNTLTSLGYEAYNIGGISNIDLPKDK